VVVSTLGGDEDVARLHVAVEEPTRVRGVERARRLSDDGQGAPRLQHLIPRKQCAEIGPVHETHGDEKLAVLLFTCLVDGDHVWVVDRRGKPRLPHEPLPESISLVRRRRKDL